MRNCVPFLKGQIQIWMKTKPIDNVSNQYFHMASADERPPPTISPSSVTGKDTSNEHIKSEITCEDFKCTPQPDVVEISNDSKLIETLSVKEIDAARYNFDRRKRIWTYTVKRPFSCDECGKEFQRSDSRNRHKTTHSGLKPFQCGECGMKFTQKNHMQKHQLTHKGDNMVPCDKCGVNFASTRILQLHQRIHEENS